MRGYSIWTKFKAIYPIVGGSASSHAVNLKTPGTYNLTFATGWTHSATGMTPNGATYANTALNPSSALTLNNTHLSFYSRTNLSAVERDIAIYQNADNPVMALGTNVGTEISDHYNYNQRISASIASSTGFYIGVRTTSTSHKLYKNNTTLGTNTSANVNILPNGNIYIGASNSGIYGITSYSTKQCAFASIGDGLTDTDAANFYTAVQAYQTTLGRSIGTQTVSDADAQAFVTAANITDQVEADAINTLVIGMKADGLWTKMKAIYPIVGGVASSHAVNLKTPGTYNLTNLNTGWTHNANGMTSLNTFAGTGIQPSTVLGLDDSHLSYFTTGFVDSSATCMIGAFNSPNRLAIYSQGLYGVNSGTWSTYTYSGGGVKFRIISRLSSTVHKFANNGSIQTGTVNSSVRPTANIELARLGGFGSDNFNGICKFASVGDGLTDTDIANFNTRVTAYQTALSRYN